MAERETVDPLVGDELIEISLEAHHVRFTFANSVLQIGADFEVLAPGQANITVEPGTKRGDLAILWNLIGKIVTGVAWDETIRVVFNDQREIVIGPCEGRFRGMIMGRHDMTVEDF
jgi:hypothetical protein